MTESDIRARDSTGQRLDAAEEEEDAVLQCLRRVERTSRDRRARELQPAICRICLATSCVDALYPVDDASSISHQLRSASKSTTQTSAPSKSADDAVDWFTGARCAVCMAAIPLDTVAQELSKSAFTMYKRMWHASHGDCVSCANVELIHALRVMPCGHAYCCECVRRMCRLALGDRALVPLRCCKTEFPVDYVREALPAPSDFVLYERFVREKSWRASDLVSDAEYAKVVQCVGGKQCPGCGVGVQRDHGCVHITCPHGHEFCFTCLREWQTCHCPLLPDAEVQRILGE